MGNGPVSDILFGGVRVHHKHFVPLKSRLSCVPSTANPFNMFITTKAPNIQSDKISI